jgi:two-component system, NarL family, sensor histidine kinase DesK
MSGGLALGSVVAALGTVRRARLVLLLLHVPMTLYLAVIASNGLGVYPPADHQVVNVLAALAVGSLQVVMSFDAAAGRVRPQRFAIYGTIVLLGTLPNLWLDDQRWFPVAWFMCASGVMVLTGWLRVVAFLVPVGIGAYYEAAEMAPLGLNAEATYATYATLIVSLGAGAILGASYVVRAVDELYDARHELADTASRSERRRAGRDLHDSLGQSLSAVSIKGDLALALLDSDPDAAAQEIQELAAIAQQAADDLDAVAHDRTTISLMDELISATRLLQAAGVAPEINNRVSHLQPGTDRLLGWAAREGTTNLLRHSSATTCRITVRRDGDLALLEIVNDGAGRPDDRRGGLAGLSERVHGAGGFIEAGRFDRDSFRLKVAVPETAP